MDYPFFTRWGSGARKYISYFGSIDQVNIFCREEAAMAQDLMRTISAMRETAVGNCRKRIEDAARKAREMIDDTPEHTPETRNGPPACGVTSILKRKHGL